ncbi:MAG: anthranilate synthase component I family protein [Nanoarchaeota archaeon]|nr:anthranilate synthase component I family protein [Nanoarchaeota archaeon]
MIIRSIRFQSPHKIYESLRCKNSILLESQKHGNNSYIALNPYLIFKSKNNTITITKNNKTTKTNGNPLEVLKKLIQKHNVKRKPSQPLFYQGAIGYLGYDLVHNFEELPKSAKDDLKLPDCYFIFPKDILHFDHKKKTATIITKNQERANAIIKKINNIKPSPQIPKTTKIIPKSNFTQAQYEKAITRCKEYVHAGDSFQIKISQRFVANIKEDPFEIYKRLRKINPSPYAAYLELDNFKVISNSPEHLVKVQKNSVETRPIGGTYPKTNNKQKDFQLLKKFKQDKKEQHEHNMLIDLERNDLGRVCKYGSIKVNEHKTIEHYSHLIHLVSNIQGELQKDKDVFNVIESMFPGGTVTGCPKIRTMEIIDEIEPVTRSLYTGSIGFINFSNEMDFNIIIRTLIVKNNKGYIQVGGGVVANSNPKKEYQETLDKAKAIFEAL